MGVPLYIIETINYFHCSTHLLPLFYYKLNANDVPIK